jgi:hypothetical protein
MNHAYVKDSQNPYRTGVLVGNHIEDRFGQEIAQKPVITISKLNNSCLCIESVLTHHY